jgi:hypothetical protein
VVERLLTHPSDVPATLNGTRQLQGGLNTPDSITTHSTVGAPHTPSPKEMLRVFLKLASGCCVVERLLIHP